MNNTVKIILGIIALILCVTGYFAYNLFINPKSPKDTVTFTQDDLIIEVTYSRPFKKERLIFGSEENDALVPYGKYWRLGANAASVFSTSTEISFAGRSLGAGKYRLYAVPEKDHWIVVLNEEYGKFGYSEPNYEKDVMRVNIPVANLLSPIEQFTIELVQDEKQLILQMRWDTTSVAIPLN